MPVSAVGFAARALEGTSVTDSASVPQVEITYFTDPLCCWSWAFEPQWRRLRYEFGPQLGWRYVMGGMIPDWSRFHDPLNAVSRPAQMGPHWFQVRQLSSMPIDERIWNEDPPTSSYLPSIAVKAAEEQGLEAGEAYLRRLREAVMVERRNIARLEVLLTLADEMKRDHIVSPWDADRFRRDVNAPAVLDAFREDLKDVRYREIGRFPTLILRPSDGPAVIAVGSRPYAALRLLLSRVAPNLVPVRSRPNVLDYVAHWGRVTAAEVAEALELDIEAAAAALDAAVDSGEAQQTPAGYYQVGASTT